MPNKVILELEVETRTVVGREMSQKEIKEFYTRLLGEAELPGQEIYGMDNFSPASGKLLKIEIL